MNTSDWMYLKQDGFGTDECIKALIWEILSVDQRHQSQVYMHYVYYIRKHSDRHAFRFFEFGGND